MSLWEFGEFFLTVSVAFNKNTHWVVRLLKFQDLGGSIHKSECNSLYIFLSEGGIVIQSCTEKQSQWASHSQWYGSCQMITTFTLLNGVLLNALKIWFHVGYMVYQLAFSCCKKSFIWLKYGFWNSSHNIFFRLGSIWGLII